MEDRARQFGGQRGRSREQKQKRSVSWGCPNGAFRLELRRAGRAHTPYLRRSVNVGFLLGPLASSAGILLVLSAVLAGFMPGCGAEIEPVAAETKKFRPVDDSEPRARQLMPSRAVDRSGEATRCYRSPALRAAEPPLRPAATPKRRRHRKSPRSRRRPAAEDQRRTAAHFGTARSAKPPATEGQ